MPGGRPTEYSEKLVTKSRKYIDACTDVVKMVPIKGTKKKYKEFVVNFPSIEGLALYLKVSRASLYNWSEEHPEFLDILEEIKQEQVKRLIDSGLSGKYNPLISKLVLAKHGYKDQVGLSGEGEGEPIKLNVDVKDAIKKVYGD